MTTFFHDEDHSDLGDAEFFQQFAQFETDDKTKLGIIFIEDISDEIFWEKIAFRHNIQLYSTSGKEITGKSKLLQICSANQLIAIDSDFDELCPNYNPRSILFSNKRQYILQTYSYSRENIEFSPQCLSEILEKKFKVNIKNHVNYILNIFEKLSDIWFEPYQKFLFLKEIRAGKMKDKQWLDWIRFQKKESQDIVLKLNFCEYEKRMLGLNIMLDGYISNKNEFQKFCSILTGKGFDKKQVWAYIRGHDFEEHFVMKIIEHISSKRRRKELKGKKGRRLLYIKNKGIPKKERNTNFSKQFQSENSIKDVLVNYFYDVYFPNHKHNDYFLQKIVADYQRVIT